MIIQLNTDKNLAGTEKLSAYVNSFISEELSRFSHQITRVEVHLSDVNGPKDGLNDKRCLIEVRLEGMKPIAVSNNANTHEQAIDGAIEKIKTSLDSMLGRMRNH
jgi:ribosome-associated translation inhibitor RaiA